MVCARDRSHKPASCRGFSLIEVLVAFAILTLALGVLLPLFSNGLRSLSISEQYTRAAVLAESRLAAIGRETPLEQGEEDGEFEQGFRWRTSVTPYEVVEDTEGTSPLADAFLTTVEVYWQDGDKRRTLTLDSLKLRPAS